jgi:hypothetical protein
MIDMRGDFGGMELVKVDISAAVHLVWEVRRNPAVFERPELSESICGGKNVQLWIPALQHEESQQRITLFGQATEPLSLSTRIFA